MMPLAALADRRVRGEFKAWRDSFAATPRKADYAWTTLARRPQLHRLHNNKQAFL